MGSVLSETSSIVFIPKTVLLKLCTVRKENGMERGNYLGVHSL